MSPASIRKPKKLGQQSLHEEAWNEHLQEAFALEEHLQHCDGANHETVDSILPQADVDNLDLLLDGPLCETHAG
jgi:hypothetical protein